jgi:hypothetical protein
VGEHKHEVRTELDIMAALCEIEEGPIPLHGITLIQVITEDGRTGRQWRIGGEPTIDQTMSLLELIKLDLYHEHRRDLDEEDE